MARRKKRKIEGKGKPQIINGLINYINWLEYHIEVDKEVQDL